MALGFAHQIRPELKRPFMLSLPPKPTVAAFLGSQAFGDFIMQNLAMAAACRDLDAGRRIAMFHNDRPYKHLIAALNPALTDRISLDVAAGQSVPLDWLNGDQAPDVMLPPSRLDLDRVRPPVPRLQVPEALSGPLAETLVHLGLDPDRWFVCLHLREKKYHYRYGVDERRSVEKDAYLSALDYLIRGAGGQVVRIGDPSMSPMSNRHVSIDLATVPDSIALQAFAVSRARFFLGVDSGPTQLASALGVPTLSTNAIGVGCWRPQDRVLFQNFIHIESEKRLSLDDLFSLMDGQLQVIYPIADVRTEQRGADDILNAVRAMLDLTEGLRGWREDWPVEPDPGPGAFGFPGKMGLLKSVQPFGVL
ncbi:MAG: TIGR04372 family glycosyltransferase [Magnetovibrionaceae bacterium]